MPLRLSNPDAVKGKTPIILLPGYKQEALCLGSISAEFGVKVRAFFLTAGDNRAYLMLGPCLKGQSCVAKSL